MRNIANIAGVAGVATLITLLFKLELASVAVGLLAVVLGIMGIFYPGDSRVEGRVTAIVSIVAGVLPILVPQIKLLALRMAEARRAKEMAPLYAKLDEQKKAIGDALVGYLKAHRYYPTYGKQGEQLQYVADDGLLYAHPLDVGVGPGRFPLDPFGNGRRLRWIAFGKEGALLVSVGQDGRPDMPIPGVWMDWPPADPVALMAVTGVDPRWVTYDPTNGALGGGDVTHWYGEKSYEDFMRPLHQAWDLAHQRAIFAPPRKEEMDKERQSTRDAREAARLYAEGKDLAALALASRAVRGRYDTPKGWDEFEANAPATRGMALYQLGNYRGAADAFLDTFIGNPNNVEAHYYLGCSYYRGGDQTNAMMHWSIAAQIDLNHPLWPEAQARIDELKAGKTVNTPRPRSISVEAPAPAKRQSAPTPAGS